MARKRSLSMLNRLIFDSSVEGGTPSRAAAPGRPRHASVRLAQSLFNRACLPNGDIDCVNAGSMWRCTAAINTG